MSLPAANAVGGNWGAAESMARMMPPIVFINLEKDAQRRARVEAEFARLKLQGQRLPAVWWKQLPAPEQNRLYSADLNQHQYYKPLVDGEKGCYASHIAAWQQLLASDAEAMVVLEDDVVLDERFCEAVQAIVALQASQGTGWDMVKLMGRAQGEKVRAQRPLTAALALIEYRRVPSFTAGYVVSRDGARKLLASRVPFGRPIDIDLRFWWENDLQVLGVQPPVVHLDVTSEDSSIAGRKPPSDLRTRWRKLAMKLRLTWGNARHLRAQKSGH
jgi:glycosyl transferase family 25